MPIRVSCRHKSQDGPHLVEYTEFITPFVPDLAAGYTDSTLNVRIVRGSA